MKTTRSTKLKDFQFRLLHMTLTTNREAFRFGLSQTEYCTFCKTEKEDIYHILLQCPVSKNIWDDLKSFLYVKTQIYLHFSNRDIIFGSYFFPFFELYNHIIMLTKQYLYASRCLGRLPDGMGLRNKIERDYKIEMMVGKAENQLNKVKEKWNPFFFTRR